MRRLIAIFLIVILPLQVTWGVIAVNCTHNESGISAQHFGHHEKANSHAVKKEGADTDVAGVDFSYDSAHHNVCDGGFDILIPSKLQTLAATPVGKSQYNLLSLINLSSIHSSRIERPNWDSLA